MGGVGEEFGVTEGCVTMERKKADELDERIRRVEVKRRVRCVRR